MQTTELTPEEINELSKFIDCMQLVHSSIIDKLSNTAIIQQIGHKLYDAVVRLQGEGKL